MESPHGREVFILTKNPAKPYLGIDKKRNRVYNIIENCRATDEPLGQGGLYYEQESYRYYQPRIR